MTTDPAMILHQWLSPAFPVGAFAYSHGLETAVAERVVSDADSTQAWIETCLRHGAGRNDAILLAAAWRAEREDGATATPADIAELADALAPSAERREEALAQGRAFAATVNPLHGLCIPDVPYAVALGQAAGALALPLDLTLRLFLQAFSANLTSAAVRLVPLGQTAGQRVLGGLLPLIETLAGEAGPGELDDLGAASFAVDIASMRHETLGTRLFRS